VKLLKDKVIIKWPYSIYKYFSDNLNKSNEIGGLLLTIEKEGEIFFPIGLIPKHSKRTSTYFEFDPKAEQIIHKVATEILIDYRFSLIHTHPGFNAFISHVDESQLSQYLYSIVIGGSKESPIIKMFKWNSSNCDYIETQVETVSFQNILEELKENKKEIMDFIEKLLFYEKIKYIKTLLIPDLLKKEINYNLNMSSIVKMKSELKSELLKEFNQNIDKAQNKVSTVGEALQNFNLAAQNLAYNIINEHNNTHEKLISKVDESSANLIQNMNSLFKIERDKIENSFSECKSILNKILKENEEKISELNKIISSEKIDTSKKRLNGVNEISNNIQTTNWLLKNLKNDFTELSGDINLFKKKIKSLWNDFVIKGTIYEDKLDKSLDIEKLKREFRSMKIVLHYTIDRNNFTIELSDEGSRNIPWQKISKIEVLKWIEPNSLVEISIFYKKWFKKGEFLVVPVNDLENFLSALRLVNVVYFNNKILNKSSKNLEEE